MRIHAINKQLVYLFYANFSILFIGMGLFPILPVYAGEFGASSTTVGIYLGLTYVSITVGTMLTSWLAQHLTAKGAFVGAGVLGVPALALLGQATALWQVVILTSAVWFAGGIGLALVSVFTGLYADENSRGKSFGLMSLAAPLGAIIGGTTVGRLVEWQGYPLMFAVLAVVWAGWPLVALWKFENGPAATAASNSKGTSGNGMQPGRVFHLLLLAALLSAVTVRVGRLGLSLSMKANAFTPGDIADANVVGGLVTLPVVLWFGMLSDWLGRKRALALGYLVAAGAALLLSAAGQVWHYWAAAALLLAAQTANGAVASAFATDFLTPEALSRGLAWLNTTGWVAGILGYAWGGAMMDALGATSLFLIVTGFALAAAVLLWLLPQKCPAVSQGRTGLQGMELAPCPEV